MAEEHDTNGGVPGEPVQGQWSEPGQAPEPEPAQTIYYPYANPGTRPEKSKGLHGAIVAVVITLVILLCCCCMCSGLSALGFLVAE